MSQGKRTSRDPTVARPGWSIGGDASLQAVLDRGDTPALLRRALRGVLAWQTRNQTTVRRALTAAGVAPTWVAALLALGASVTVETDGKAADLPLETYLKQRVEGRVSALHLPDADRRWGEAHVARTPADQPIVAAVAVAELDGSTVRQARVALTGVWPEPVRLAAAPARLVGGPLDEEPIRAVAAAVEQEVDPSGDFRGSAEYRRAMAGVLTRRALQECLGQEGEDE